MGAASRSRRTASCVGRAAAFAEDTLIVDTAGGTAAVSPWDEAVESEVFAALVLGVRDYARKCGFTRALLGLSGGIDSALTAVIAAEALGGDNVTGVLMPSPFSSEGSLTDARDLADTLGIRTHTLPIAPVMSAFEGVLAGAVCRSRHRRHRGEPAGPHSWHRC